MDLRIVADENLTRVEDIFNPLGDVKLVDGRSLKRSQLSECDVLLVRSVTQVNRELLHGTPVAAVGTATSGMDHMDVDYLQAAGIYQCQAAGANAESVIDYVLSSIAITGSYLETLLDGGRVGIIGCGRVGGRLYDRLSAMGVAVVGYDPLLKSAAARRLSSLEEVLQSDVIAMHTPLTKLGDYPSYHQLGAIELGELRGGQLLINAGRGGTVDNDALLLRLQQTDAPSVVLDVWEGEPELSQQLLSHVSMGTPHIAGYSYDGKCRATAMLFEQIFQHFFESSSAADNMSPAPATPLNLPAEQAPGLHGAELLRVAIKQVYDVRRDDHNLRSSLLDSNSTGNSFDQLRRNYPERHEFSAYSFSQSQVRDAVDIRRLTGAGFRCLP